MFTRASKPTFCLTDWYSRGDNPFEGRSIYWYLMRRSLNQRSAFFVSKHFDFPNICMFMFLLLFLLYPVTII